MANQHPLKLYRKSRNPKLTQFELAELLGVDRVTVARWETGARKLNKELLPEVAEKTGIAAAKLRPDLARHFAKGGA